MPLHDAVDLSLIDDHEPTPSVQRPHQVPLEISELQRHSVGVRKRKAVVQDPRPQTPPLMGGEQVELIETQMVSKGREGDGADGLSIVHNPA